MANTDIFQGVKLKILFAIKSSISFLFEADNDNPGVVVKPLDNNSNADLLVSSSWDRYTRAKSISVFISSGVLQLSNLWY